MDMMVSEEAETLMKLASPFLSNFGRDELLTVELAADHEVKEHQDLKHIPGDCVTVAQP